MERHCDRKPVGPASDVLNALGGGRRFKSYFGRAVIYAVPS